MAEFWFRLTVAGDPEPMYSKFSLLKTSPSALTQLDADQLADIINLQLVGRYNGDFTFGPHFVKDGRIGPPVRIDCTVPVGVGNGAAIALPNNCAYLIKCQTGVGRGGRIFLVGANEDQVNGAGFIASGERIATQAMLNTLYGNLSTHPAISTPGMWVKTGLNAYTETAITSYVIQPQIATQRKRMRR